MTKTRNYKTIAAEATAAKKRKDLTAAQYTFLETRLGASFKWKCPHCLEAVYDRVTKGSGGYVIDDEMIESLHNNCGYDVYPTRKKTPYNDNIPK
jgi:rubrerythrin